MKYRKYGRLSCALLLCWVSGCGVEQAVGQDGTPIRSGDADGGSDTRRASTDDQDSASGGSAGSTAERDAQGASEDDTAGSDEAGPNDREGASEGDSDSASATDDGTTSSPDAGAEPIGDAGVEEDPAGGAGDCESLRACCEQQREGQRRSCATVADAADDVLCAQLEQRMCPRLGDAGLPRTPMPCEQVLPCCDQLEGREQAMCEAAATAPEGRACERALDAYCH